MGNAKLDPRSLTPEERAIVDALVLRYLDACLPLTDAQLFQRAAHLSQEMIVARRKFFGQPASEPAKVECPNCGELTSEPHTEWVPRDEWQSHEFTCQPAQPEPVAAVDEEPNGWLALWQSASDGSWYACKRLVSSETEALDAARYEAGKDTPVRAFKFRGVPAPDREALRPVLDALRLGSISTRKASELARQWALGEELDSFTPAPDEPVEVMTGEEPVAEEMPEAVRGAVGTLREFSRNLAMRDGFYSARDSRVAREAADALESFWRTHAARPAKVRMTEELERVLATAVHGAAAYMNAKMYGHAEEARLAIAAVRAGAAEAGKVRLPKVRSYFLSLSMLPEYRNDEGRAFLAEVKAELDAAEGGK